MNNSSENVSTTNSSANLNVCDLYTHRATARVLLPLHYTFVCLVGVFGNILAILAIKKKQKKMNSSTLYSMNLVVSDILFAVILPTRIIYYARGFNWPFGEAICRIVSLVCYSNTYASVSFMICLSLDRFLVVIYPFRHTKFRNVKNVKKICIIVWIIVFCQTVPLLIIPMSKKDHNFITCMEYPNFETIPNLPGILLGGCLVGYCLPVIIMMVCYSQISSKLSKTAKQNPLTEKSGRNKKANNIVLLVLIVFVLCFTPYHITIIQHMIKKLSYEPTCQEKQYFQIALHITVSVMNFNCCMDPFIYFFACKGYRSIVLKIIRRHASISLSSGTKANLDNSSPGTENRIHAVGTASDTNL
ncbi:G-protein coupled receptor 183-A [Callorhinchus milii]|uniref:G protein-coupled receptor 183b n=1 Tax=Callorhinchus milii TaxID=7868 RepID=V9KMZ8_CALMI|nr:G-protein coupled receptor 183-A [Callorhinchus milii]|eukprot:gi/632975904/ref/XP_007904489.1/ PREDICTED: G-protein coupled receptor 183 [Callorhinchus milii]